MKPLQRNGVGERCLKGCNGSFNERLREVLLLAPRQRDRSNPKRGSTTPTGTPA